ncbi:MAG: hypothetical protein JW953_07190 [Anaerolineae bacterium]|nr:hypothetical protein [Anaerolineae bacterium]
MLNAVYWFQPDPGPLTAKAWLIYAFYVFFFLGWVAWSGWQLLRPPVHKSGGAAFHLPHFELAIGLAGLALVGARLALVPGWSARIWPPLLLGLTLSGPALRVWASRPTAPLDHAWALLTFREVGPPLPLRWQLGLWAFHLAGLAGWVRAVGRPFWWSVVLWNALLALQLLLAGLTSPHRRRIYVTPLLPLGLAYFSAGLCLLFNLPQSTLPVPTYPGLATLYWLPFYLSSMTVAAVLYTLLLELFYLKRNLTRIMVYPLAGLLIAASLGWLAFELFSHRTHGVTGTDPYGYAQVAVDLVERGTVLHQFDLFPRIADLPLAWAPVIALGYHLPLNAAGQAASVWPLGMSILLAGGYRLFGESGLYITTPLLALLTALSVGWLTLVTAMDRFRFKDGLPPAWAFMAGGAALLVWATSYEVVDRALVPMADVAAALFTTLMWLALLKVHHKSKELLPPFGSYLMPAFIAGLALGLAFDVRYTQLMLGASLILGLAWLRGVTRRQQAALLALSGAGALLTALPDIVYRWRVFGSPLANPQARELAHFAPANIGPTFTGIFQEMFRGPELGLLAPFLLVGLIWHWRQDRRGWLILAAGALAVLLLQLPYQSLRLRDLLPLFPLLAVWTGLGWTWTWRLLVNAPLRPAKMPPRLANLLIMGAICLTLLLPLVRITPLVTRAWQPHRASFGYVTISERAALAKINLFTPDPAAIGVHYNGGAITLHSQRWIFYPGGWTEAELSCFLARMAHHGTPVFLLNDGPSVQPTIARLAAAARLRPIACLDVPLPAGDDASGQLYEVLGSKTYSETNCKPENKLY